jgi:hypothetical protein
MRSAAIAVLATLLLAACGSSSKPAANSAPPTTNPPPTTTPGSSSSVTTATASTPTATTTTTAGASTLCRASGLAISFLGQQGATGHGELGFAVRNTSSSSCHTFGYPGIQFLDGAGRALPTVSTRTTQDFFGNTSEERLVIAPGQSFSFRIGVTHSGSGGSNAGCTTAAAVGVIPPDDTFTLHVNIPQGAYECGTATVSPVRPGNSAYP